MKSSTQVILPFLVLAGMLKDAQSCAGLSRQACNDALFCMWDRFNGSGCVPTFGSAQAQATQFNIIPSDSDGLDYDHKLLHKGRRPDQEGYLGDVDKKIDSTGDDVSDFIENDDVSDTFFSAISVGGGSRLACRELPRSRCRVRSDCRLVCVRFNCHCVPTFRSAQATQFNIIPSDSGAPDDYELLHKGRPNQAGYVVDVDKKVDSTRHSDSGDDVSDCGYDYDYGGNDPGYDLYPYDEDMDEDYEDISSDEYDPYGEDMDEDEDSNSSSLDVDGDANANGDASIIKKYLRSN